MRRDRTSVAPVSPLKIQRIKGYAWINFIDAISQKDVDALGRLLSNIMQTTPMTEGKVPVKSTGLILLQDLIRRTG